MQIAADAVVSIHYHLRNSAGETLDKSDGDRPLVYIHGAGNIIPGLEEALEGKTVGAKLNVVVAPADGYGERVEALIQVVPRDAFGGTEDLHLGQQFHADTQHGPMVIQITKIEGDQITVDGNHELAGVELHFDVEVVGVREATEEELDHGHVHDGHCGGHH